MSTFTLLKDELSNRIFTENGDLAYSTTYAKNLDFFGLAGASRYRPSQALDLFKEAFQEDSDLALMNLFYLRDVRGGLGERDAFRVCFEYLCNEYPDLAKQLFEYVIEYGRYDDLFVAAKTKVDQELFDLIKKQLLEDVANKSMNGTCSLLSKWMPSINASKRETIRLGLYFAQGLNYSKKEYRQLLSFLRKGLIIENNLREKDYTFDYGSVPGKAMYRYKETFLRNDNLRYNEFIERVRDGDEQIKVKTLYPYEIIKEFRVNMDELSKAAMIARWNALERQKGLDNTIVVRDGSGSMTCNNCIPLDIATSMSILCSEQLTDEFKNSFITFSSHPELVTFPEGSSLYDKLEICELYDDCSNTDIQKVYDLIYNVSLKIKDEKDYIKRVIIISDMEFDYGVDNVPTYESMESKFRYANLPLPEIVYWNVDARRVHFASNLDHPNIKYVSGASINVIDSIIKGSDLDAVELMKKTLMKYEKIIKTIRQN